MSKLQHFNIHTHTYRCGHAVGSEREYIESAIKLGYEHIGISEHIGIEGWVSKGDRMTYDEMPDYFQTLRDLKEEYKDRIKVYIGLEFEYFEEKKDYLKSLTETCDYMVLGQHYDKVDGKHYYIECSDEDVEIYSDLICTALEKNLTKYVAHPSYPMLSRGSFGSAMEKAIEKIAVTAKRKGAALEWNLKGMSKGIEQYEDYESYAYPHKKALEIIKDIGTNVVIGYDAHSPNFLGERSLEKEARLLLSGLNIVESPEMFLYKNF